LGSGSLVLAVATCTGGVSGGIVCDESVNAALALQLLFPMSSESMGDHDSGPDDWWRVS